MFKDYEFFAFGELLRGFRERHGLTQQQLADQLKKHVHTVAGWEKSTYLPKVREDVLSLETALALAESEVNLLLYKANMPLVYTQTDRVFGYLYLRQDDIGYPLRGKRPVIGREPGGNDVVIPMVFEHVSRHHAAIYEDGGVVYVEDLASRHGTFIDGERVTQPTPLEEGRHLLLGGRRADEGVCVLEYLRKFFATK